MRVSGGRASAALLLAAVAGCSGSTSADDPPRASRPASYDASTPVGLALAAGKVWTVEADGGAVSARATATGPAVTVHVGDTPLRAAYDGSLLWVSVFGAGQVVAVDPARNRVVRRVRMPGQPEGIVAAFGSVWVVRQQARLLTEVTASGAGRSYHLGDEPRLVAASDRYLFVSNFGGDTVTRVDPRSGAVATSRQICFGPQGLVADDAVVWVTCTTEGKLVALDPQTLRIRGQVRIADEPDAVRLVGNRLFVAVTQGPTVVEVNADPEHPSILRAVPLGHAAQLFDQANVDLVIADGAWWVSSPSDNRVLVYTP